MWNSTRWIWKWCVGWWTRVCSVLSDKNDPELLKRATLDCQCNYCWFNYGTNASKRLFCLCRKKDLNKRAFVAYIIGWVDCVSLALSVGGVKEWTISAVTHSDSIVRSFVPFELSISDHNEGLFPNSERKRDMRCAWLGPFVPPGECERKSVVTRWQKSKFQICLLMIFLFSLLVVPSFIDRKGVKSHDGDE